MQSVNKDLFEDLLVKARILMVGVNCRTFFNVSRVSLSRHVKIYLSGRNNEAGAGKKAKDKCVIILWNHLIVIHLHTTRKETFSKGEKVA